MRPSVKHPLRQCWKTKSHKRVPKKLNIRTYAKYLLKEGSFIEKRELLANLRSRLMYEDKKIALLEDNWMYAEWKN